MNCVKCSGPTDGYICDQCGDEMPMYVKGHECGGEHVVPKCQECEQPQTDCTCSSE